LSTDSRHQAVWDWLRTCPHITDLFFNFSQSDVGDTSLVTSEDVAAQYIDGSKLMRYECALVRVLPASFEPNDVTNLEAALDLDELEQWIDEQNDAGAFPAFPERLPVQEILLHPNTSGFAVAEDGESAKYMLQFSIEYLKP